MSTPRHPLFLGPPSLYKKDVPRKQGASHTDPTDRQQPYNPKPDPLRKPLIGQTNNENIQSLQPYTATQSPNPRHRLPILVHDHQHNGQKGYHTGKCQHFVLEGGELDDPHRDGKRKDIERAHENPATRQVSEEDEGDKGAHVPLTYAVVH